ncbi:MAG: peptide ABC transporter substrate-binding protein, partial [Planctomycetota bacterium]|nr:peptide ABC transporter substrate-binding protein [Planctomycetota bacterium]
NKKIRAFKDIPERDRKKFRSEFEKQFTSGADIRDLPKKQQKAFYAARDKDFDDTVKLKALDDYRLEMRLDAPTPYFNDLLCFYATSPVNKECVEEHKQRWTRPKNIVTNGPFYLKTQRFNERIRLQRSQHYWDVKNVGMESIDALAVEDLTTSLNMYLEGTVDWIPQVPPKLMKHLQERDDYHNFPSLIVYFYRCNVNLPVFKGEKGKKVRQALSLAIDRQTLVDTITKAWEKPAYSIVPPGIEGYKPPTGLRGKDFKDNVAMAKKLLAEAGYPNGKGLPTITLLYNTDDKHAAIAATIQDFWRTNLGIKIELQNQEWGTYLDSVNGLKFDMARAGWIGDYTDPNTFLDMWLTDGPQNNTGWGSKRYDRLLKYSQNIVGTLGKKDSRDAFLKDLPNFKSDVDLYLKLSKANEKRVAAVKIRFKVLNLMDTIIADELPIIPIYFYTTNQLWNKDLDGLYDNLRDTHMPKYFRWKKGSKRAKGGKK